MRPEKSRKLQKYKRSLQNSGISICDEPTNILFVSNSSLLVGVSLENLEALFRQFHPDCTFFVYPSSKSYSFVEFPTVEAAMEAKSRLDGRRPESFPPENSPIMIFYVDKLPKTTLQTSQNQQPNGLLLIPEFVNKITEVELIEFIERELLKRHEETDTKLKNRRVLHFGHKFNYQENNALVPTEEPIPPIMVGLIDKIIQHFPAHHYRPDQITVNIYEPGQGIAPHTDTHSAFAEPIYSLSLCSDVVMEFRDIASTGKHCDVLLARRSLLEMTNEARYRFKHGIKSRKYDINPLNNRLISRQRRISITFRTRAHEPCQCPFIEFCDWDREGQMQVPNSNAKGQQLEREYVEKVYDRIADHFDQTRHSNWTGISEFLHALPPFSLLLDIGCGNGKYLFRRDQLVKLGCDVSSNLLKIAQQKGCTVFRADALELPTRDACFDAVISIAVIHHFSTLERRQRAIREILRILKPGGIACVTAWSFEQTSPDGQTESIYAAKMRSNKSSASVTSLDDNDDEKVLADIGHAGKLRVHDGRHFTQQDMLVPWASASKEQTVVEDFRYYHLFTRGELAQLVMENVNQAELINEHYDEGNWVVVFRRRE